jgi:cardiolipin synthase
MLEFLAASWPYVLLTTYIVVGALAAMHAVLSRRDVRSAIGWVGLILLAPIIGATLYILLGVNRVQRTAIQLRGGEQSPRAAPSDAARDEVLWRIYEQGHGHFTTLAELIGRLTELRLTTGNRVTPLAGGDEAYPAMIRAINEAQHCVALSTYIFDNDAAGEMFAEALHAAVKRGLAVRVLIDDVGSRYSFPTSVRKLRKLGVPVARFMPALTPTMVRFFNLRNHRKILVADGRLGFTGGMNIRAGHMLSSKAKHHAADLHFMVEGPVVWQLQDAFALDWAFTTREILDGPVWFPPLEEVGESLARGIPDGPDDDVNQLQLAFMGALSCARRRVRICTPYFLPELPLMDALAVCAMRGVEIDIVLPSANNIKPVHWAMLAHIRPLLERGIRIWLTPPPFDHTKLMVVDDAWSCFGSTNWDPRSLRLNFEFNLECYDRDLAGKLTAVALKKIMVAKPLTIDELHASPLWAKLRNGITRLMLPYL